MNETYDYLDPKRVDPESTLYEPTSETNVANDEEPSDDAAMAHIEALANEAARRGAVPAIPGLSKLEWMCGMIGTAALERLYELRKDVIEEVTDEDDEALIGEIAEDIGKLAQAILFTCEILSAEQ